MAATLKNKNERHEQFMGVALVQAEAALKQGEFPVGCVLVAKGNVLAKGQRKNTGAAGVNEIDHAEIVTLRALLKENPDVDCGEIIVYSTMEPCLMCFTTLLLSGIRRFVWAYEDVMGGGTSLDLTTLPPLYAEMTVELISGIKRDESLRLFQEFFQNYSYWQDSHLERYTLEQP